MSTHLAGVASMARISLGCDAVVISELDTDHQSRVIGAAGIGEEVLRRAWPLLHDTEQRVRITAPAPGPDGSPTRRGLSSHGYVIHWALPLAMDGERLGAIHLLSADLSYVLDRALFEAFAAHCSVAVAYWISSRHVSRLEHWIERLCAFDESLMATHRLADLIPRLAAAIASVLEPVRVGVVVPDEEAAILRMVPGSFGASPALAASWAVRVDDLRSNTARVFTLRRPYISNQVPGDPGMLQEYVEPLGLHRIMSLPLVVADRTVGVLHLANKQTSFTVADLLRGEFLAPRVALAVESIRAAGRLRVQQHIDRALSDVAVAIATGVQTADFLETGLDALSNALDAAVIAVVPDDREPTVLGPMRSEPRAVALVARARVAHHEMAEFTPPSHGRHPGSASLHLPIRVAARRVGVLSAMRTHGETFQPIERGGLSRMSDLVALAWASEQYQEQRTVLTRLEERQRLADDLHDDVVQLLFAAQLQLDSLTELPDIDARIDGRIRHARALLVRSDTAMRNMISQLSRPAAGTLSQRLVQVVADVQEEFMIPVYLDAADLGERFEDDLPRSTIETLAKVAREALVNAAKHARPTRVTVAVDRSKRGCVRLRIVDDGVGIGPARNVRSHGITALRRSVRNEGGTLRIYRGHAGGTVVAASVPTP